MIKNDLSLIYHKKIGSDTLRIRELRKARLITQCKLSEMTGISLAQMHRIDAGVCLPGADKLPSIARALCCRIDDLYTPEEMGAKTSAQTFLTQEQVAETPPLDGLERDLDDVLEW